MAAKSTAKDATPDSSEGSNPLDHVEMAPGIEHTPYENTLNTYYALYDSTVDAHDLGDAKSRLHAEDTARVLIEYAGIPLIIRCRALCVLGCSDDEDSDYLRYAEEAVYFAEVAVRQENEAAEDGEKRTDTEKANLILECCLEVLEGAKGAKAAATNAGATNAAKVEAEADEEDSDEEVVWNPDWDDEHKARVKASWAPWPPEAEATTPTIIQEPTLEDDEQKADEQKKKKVKNARSVDSGNPDAEPQWEEFDLVTGRFVPLGTAQSVEWVDPDDDETPLD